MTIAPVTLKEAARFVGEHHRHNQPPRGWRFGVSLRDPDGEIRGVAVAGQPVARVLDDGATIEVTRVCTLGDRNASSRLYGAVCRAAKALGYARAITYTLTTESGVSLRASGFREVDRVKGGRSWTSKGRGRYDSTLWGDRIVPTEDKIRWERTL